MLFFRGEDVTEILSAFGVDVTDEGVRATVLSRLERLNVDWAADALEPWQRNALIMLGVKLLMEFAVMSVASRRELVLGEINAELEDHVRMTQRRQRLKDLVCQTSDVVLPLDHHHLQRIESFFSAVPSWTTAASADKCVIPLDAVDPGFLIQRTHSQHGSCYMQAAVVLLSYKICLNRHKAGLVHDEACVDVTEHVLRRVNPGRMWDFIWSDEGGHASTFLKTMSGLSGPDVVEYGPGVVAHELEKSDRWLVDKLHRHGPALVVTMDVEVGPKGELIDELKLAQHTYSAWTEPSAPSTTAHHSVLIIGWNVLPSGKVWYLVQNWWDDKQFFQVDNEFLLSREARLAFIISDKLVELPTLERIRHGKVFSSAAFGQPSACNRSLCA